MQEAWYEYFAYQQLLLEDFAAKANASGKITNIVAQAVRPGESVNGMVFTVIPVTSQNFDFSAYETSPTDKYASIDFDGEKGLLLRGTNVQGVSRVIAIIGIFFEQMLLPISCTINDDDTRTYPRIVQMQSTAQRTSPDNFQRKEELDDMLKRIRLGEALFAIGKAFAQDSGFPAVAILPAVANSSYYHGGFNVGIYEATARRHKIKKPGHLYVLPLIVEDIQQTA